MLVALEDNHAPKDELLRVEWNLGKRCNYNCSYCGNELHNKTSDHMSWEVYTATIDKIVEASNGKKISHFPEPTLANCAPIVCMKGCFANPILTISEEAISLILG